MDADEAMRAGMERMIALMKEPRQSPRDPASAPAAPSTLPTPDADDSLAGAPWSVGVSMLGPGVLERGAVVGRHVVLQMLGAGGMGVVHAAYDPELDRKVALKLLLPGSAGASARTRLLREAQALAKLSHPNVVAIHDVGTTDDQVWLAMEFVEGQTLDVWLETPRDWREVVKVMCSAGEGLAAAHAAKLLHRDFKPANVMVGADGRVRVMDFGLVRAEPTVSSLEHEELHAMPGVETLPLQLTKAGAIIGTPAYMAPEQFGTGELTAATDQFAFCVTLWEALYGERPFRGRTLAELAANVVAGRLQPPPKRRAVPSWLRRTCERGLSLSPRDRWASMLELIAALQADPARRRRRALLAAGTAVLAVVGVYDLLGPVTSEASVCTGAEAHMAEVWGPTHEAIAEAAFVATELPYALDSWTRVERELDARAAAWIEHHTHVCEATNVRHEQSPSLMDARMACLERRRGEMRALVEVFQTPDDRVVEEALVAVQGLEDSAGCSTVLEDGSAALDPAMRSRAAEVEDLLARSKVRSTSGHPQPAIELAAEALERARDLGHRPTLARAAVHYAQLRAERATDADGEIVRDELIEAIAMADETDQADLEVEGWAKLITLEGARLGRPETGLALRIPAQVALRHGAGIRSEAVLEQALGGVLYANQDVEGSLRAQLRALEKWKAAVGEQHTSVAGVLSNIGAAYAELGQLEDAQRYLEQAAEMIEQLYGPNHPMRSSIHINLGGVLATKGDAEGALVEYRAAVRLLQEAMPPGHIRTLNAMVGLAQAEQQTDPARAEALFEEVLAIMRARERPDPVLMASTQNSLGRLLRIRARSSEDAGDAAGADAGRRRAFDNLTAALQTFEQLPGENRPTNKLKLVQLNLCFLERDRRRLAEAAAHCGAAWTLQEEQGHPDPLGLHALQTQAELELELGHRAEAEALLRKGIGASTPQLTSELRIALADLLWDRGPSSRAEAIDWVREADEAMEGLPDFESSRVDTRRWLDEHRP